MYVCTHICVCMHTVVYMYTQMVVLKSDMDVCANMWGVHINNCIHTSFCMQVCTYEYT